MGVHMAAGELLRSSYDVTGAWHIGTSVIGDEDCLLAGKAAVSIAAGDLACRVPQHARWLNAILCLQHVH